MPVATLRVSLSEKQFDFINSEVELGRYKTANQAIREALRVWMQARIAADLRELERSHAGAWERDTTAEEQAAILRAKRKARAEALAGLKAPKVRRAWASRLLITGVSCHPRTGRRAAS